MTKFGTFQPFIEQPLLPLYQVKVLGWKTSLLDVVNDCLTFKCETPYEVRFDKVFVRPASWDGRTEHLSQSIIVYELDSIGIGIAKVVLFAEGVVGVPPSELSYTIRETGKVIQVVAYKSEGAHRNIEYDQIHESRRPAWVWALIKEHLQW